MSGIRLRLMIAVLLLALAGNAVGQGSPTRQTPRQAIVEMFTGGESEFKKHLTLEMQNKLKTMMKGAADGVPVGLQTLAGVKASGGDGFQAFDIGPILFSFNNPQSHERYEVQLDTDDPRGDEDMMGLSLHLVRNGVEQELPMTIKISLEMKRQEGTWRLNEITLSAMLPVGDPRILDQSWWTPSLLTANNVGADSTANPVVMDERPKLSPLRAVRMIGMAENIYAQSHPGVGYTCTMSDLVNVGKGMDEDGIYKFMEPDFADGVYNGYRFTITGCEHQPSRGFRVTAEPVTGKGKAYCSDNTNSLRTSDDGRGLTCLTTGRIARK